MKMFFELLQVAIGHRVSLSRTLTIEEWSDIYEMSLKQTIAGVMFSGVERLSEQQRPPREIILKWFSLVSRIEARNRRVNEVAVNVSRRLCRDGFRNVILKGQGVAAFYPQPLRRQSGDIDILLEGNRKDVIAYVRRFTPDVEALYHHIQFPVIADVEIEVHFIPSFCINPFTDRCLQRFFTEEASFDNHINLPGKVGEIAIPTERLNRIFLLRHTFGHFLSEGVGLRQITDYYYLLNNSKSKVGVEEQQLLKRLGMYKFAGALMYVLHHIFRLEPERMIVPMNEKEGKFLLQEVMQTGNFGHEDTRIQGHKANSHIGRFLQRQCFYMRMLRHYPGEVVWMPYFDIKRFFTAKKR
ncbi:nucleotidyltransferase family protein [Prevotella sp. PCHR]|uniref:Nucleotidyltransferase family protein n=1 Tax=Xylanibacter caecicola TaxID=2736294 RepID=A0ABX2B1B9_9BACT|nr:nucleotidyltransferase family protein [Xylanibacter caecicola]NPE25078.1 nucleotidyltransferase family protein [Xylanibacter caecicola]